jgi:hypothetical protein
MKKNFTLYLLIILIMPLSKLSAQPYTVFASGFNNLIGISRDANGNLFVGEAGSGSNDSKISMITPGANIYPVITGLPSFVDTTTGEVPGAWRAEMISDSTLMVINGGGMDSLAGTIMFFNLKSWIPGMSAPLSIADTDSLVNVSAFVYSQNFAESDPYSAAIGTDGNLYVAEAAANAIIKYDFVTDSFSVLDTFPGFSNPFPPPTSTDYVPTRIINNPSGGFYMCNLGAFVPGAARIITVDSSGNTSVLDSGFTSLVDIQYDSTTGDIYALQFGMFDSTFQPVPGSSKIFRIDQSGNISLVDTGFGPSAGFVLDGSGGAYVTEIGTGNILYFSDITGIKNIQANKNMAVTSHPNPFLSSVNINFNSGVASKAELIIKNITGQTIYTSSQWINNGENQISWDGKTATGLEVPAGNYFITIKTSTENATIKVLKQ